MSKKEFLVGLEQALIENMSIAEASAHIKYYREYIESEVAKGKTEEEVISKLQSPRLIAKNIIDNSVIANKYDNNIRKTSYDESKHYYSDNKQGGKNSTGFGFSINGKPVNSLFAKIVFLVVAIFLVVIVCAIVSGIIWLLFKVIFPIIIVLALMAFIAKWFKNNK